MIKEVDKNISLGGDIWKHERKRGGKQHQLLLNSHGPERIKLNRGYMSENTTNEIIISLQKE